MKHLIILSTSLIVILTFSNCSSSKSSVTPTQNSALNTITKSNASTNKEGAMQKSLNSWLINEWEPTISKDDEIKQKYMQKKKVVDKKTGKEKEIYVEKKEKNFTLQEYIDKAAVYNKAHPSDYNSSHVKKVESLPVIGK